MPKITMRGGAQVGWLSASWPLASIKIAPGSLTLKAFGGYSFSPSEVQAIEAVGSIPVLTTGIRIHHTRSDYPEKVVFYSMGGREALLQAASSAGFNVGQPSYRSNRGFPVRISAVVIAIILWNFLFLLDRQGKGFFGVESAGPFSLLALTLAFLVATLTPHSSRLQGLILRDGREVGEIRGFLRLLQFVSGVLAVTGLWSLWSK